MKEKFEVLSRAVCITAVLILAVIVSGCKTLRLPEVGLGRESKEMPGARTGFLPAKVAVFRHAMEHMAPEDLRYGTEMYAAAGIHDADAAHTKVLVLALSDMSPPVVEATSFYTRDENSHWTGGKPAIVWTSKVKEARDDLHVFIIVGWLHSNLLYQFYEYETRYLKDADAWEVVDYKPIDRVE